MAGGGGGGRGESLYACNERTSGLLHNQAMESWPIKHTGKDFCVESDSQLLGLSSLVSRDSHIRAMVPNHQSVVHCT